MHNIYKKTLVACINWEKEQLQAFASGIDKDVRYQYDICYLLLSNIPKL